MGNSIPAGWDELTLRPNTRQTTAIDFNDNDIDLSLCQGIYTYAQINETQRTLS